MERYPWDVPAGLPTLPAARPRRELGRRATILFEVQRQVRAEAARLAPEERSRALLEAIVPSVSDGGLLRAVPDTTLQRLRTLAATPGEVAALARNACGVLPPGPWAALDGVLMDVERALRLGALADRMRFGAPALAGTVIHACGMADDAAWLQGALESFFQTVAGALTGDEIVASWAACTAWAQTFAPRYQLPAGAWSRLLTAVVDAVGADGGDVVSRVLMPVGQAVGRLDFCGSWMRERFPQTDAVRALLGEVLLAGGDPDLHPVALWASGRSDPVALPADLVERGRNRFERAWLDWLDRARSRMQRVEAFLQVRNDAGTAVGEAMERAARNLSLALEACENHGGLADDLLLVLETAWAATLSASSPLAARRTFLAWFLPTCGLPARATWQHARPIVRAMRTAAEQSRLPVFEQFGQGLDLLDSIPDAVAALADAAPESLWPRRAWVGRGQPARVLLAWLEAPDPSPCGLPGEADARLGKRLQAPAMPPALRGLGRSLMPGGPAFESWWTTQDLSPPGLLELRGLLSPADLARVLDVAGAVWGIAADSTGSVVKVREGSTPLDRIAPGLGRFEATGLLVEVPATLALPMESVDELGLSAADSIRVINYLQAVREAERYQGEVGDLPWPFAFIPVYRKVLPQTRTADAWTAFWEGHPQSALYPFARGMASAVPAVAAAWARVVEAPEPVFSPDLVEDEAWRALVSSLVLVALVPEQWRGLLWRLAVDASPLSSRPDFEGFLEQAVRVLEVARPVDDGPAAVTLWDVPVGPWTPPAPLEKLWRESASWGEARWLARRLGVAAARQDHGAAVALAWFAQEVQPQVSEASSGPLLRMIRSTCDRLAGFGWPELSTVAQAFRRGAEERISGGDIVSRLWRSVVRLGSRTGAA